MSTKWFYNTAEYTTEAEANQAVLSFKDRLDNNPTDWVVVKELSGNAGDGWVVSATTLTDSEINSLDDTKYYSVSAVISGDSDVGLSASEATAKIAEHRTAYADYRWANTISKVQQYSPSNADMSGYTSS